MPSLLLPFSHSALSDSATPWAATRQASMSFPTSQSLLKLMCVDSVMLNNHLVLCHPLLPLPSTFPSRRIFSSESSLHIRWPKYWSFSFSVSPSSEYSGLMSFRMKTKSRACFSETSLLRRPCHCWPTNHPQQASTLFFNWVLLNCG